MLVPYFKTEFPNWKVTYLLQPEGYYIGAPMCKRGGRGHLNHHVRVTHIDVEARYVACHIAPPVVTNNMASVEEESPWTPRVSNERYNDVLLYIKTELLEAQRLWDGTVPANIEEEVGFPAFLKIVPKMDGISDVDAQRVGVPAHYAGFAQVLNMGLSVRIREMAKMYLPKWADLEPNTRMTPEGRCDLQTGGAPLGFIEYVVENKYGVTWKQGTRIHNRITT